MLSSSLSRLESTLVELDEYSASRYKEAVYYGDVYGHVTGQAWHDRHGDRIAVDGALA